MLRRRFVLFSIFFVVSNCHAGAWGGQEKQEGRTLRKSAQSDSESPAGRKQNRGPAPTFKDVKYGSHERDLMNFWQVKADQPLGILIDIHGGGWIGGGKKEVIPGHFLNRGYHFASISYPLVTQGAVQPTMLNSALRGVQFVRYKAKEWNVDPQRIVVSGGSAGGCSSLLVALHDDVANPESNDPVERFSSRVAGAAVAGAQTTVNPFVIKERIGKNTFKNGMTYKPFGAATAEEIMDNWEEYRDIVLKCSPVTHVSKDDPPIYLSYSVERLFPAPNSRNGIHSPIFGELMLEQCTTSCVECYLPCKEEDRSKPAVSREQFLNKLLLKK